MTILAHQLARAVSHMFKHKTAVDLQKFLTGSGRGVGELDAELDDQGMPLTRYARHETHGIRTTASRNADARIGHDPCALRLMRHRRLLLLIPREWSTVHVCCSSPEPDPHWNTLHVYPVVCRGRYEGTARFLGRRERTYSSRPSSFTRRENLNTCVVQPPGCTSMWQSRQDTRPMAYDASLNKAAKNATIR